MRHLPRRAVIGGLGASAMALGAGFYISRPRNPSPREVDHERLGPLRMAWADARYEPMLSLCQHGIFDRYGIDLTLTPTDTDSDSINCLNTSDPVDLVVAPLLDWLPAFFRPNVPPPPAKLICSIRTGYYRVIVRRDQHINKIANLRGKKIGITTFHGADRRFLSIRLRRKFLPPIEDVTWLRLPVADMARAFLEGRIDAFVLHDDASWRVLKAVGRSGWNMLDSMTGMARNRVDLVLGIAHTSLQKYPHLAKRLTSCFLSAQHTYPSQLNNLIKTWNTRSDAPPDLAGMLKRQTGGTVLTNDLLRVQIAQYVDEFKLLNLIPSSSRAAQIAEALTYKL